MKNRNSSGDCRKSVEARLRELLAAYQDLSNAPREIIAACESQNSLANLSVPKKGITALSRNSLYKYADLFITEYVVPDGNMDSGKSGYDYLDWLRKTIKRLAKTQASQRTKVSREQRFQARIIELTQMLESAREHSLGVSKAYLSVLHSIKYLHSDPNLEPLMRQRLINLLNDHDRLYGNLFDEVGTIRPGNIEILHL